jgi:PAS domain S-box-containing protein
MLDSIILLSIIIFDCSLGFYVLLKKPKDIINQTFFSLFFSISAWILGVLFIENTTNTATALLWIRLCFCFATVIPLALYVFTASFPDKQLNIKSNWSTLLGSILLIIMPLILFSDMMVKRAIPSPWGYEFDHGILHPVFAGYFIVLVFTAISKLFSKFIRSKNAFQKVQLYYISLGVFVSALIGITANIIMPLLGTSRYRLLGPFGTSIMALSITYAVVKHHLLNIQILIKRSFVYSILIAIIIGSYSAFAFLIGHLISRPQNLIWALLIQVMMLAIGLKPLEAYISRITNHFFFKGNYDYRKTLFEITHQMAAIMKLEELLEMLSQTIVKKMNVFNVSIFLKEKNSFQLKIFKRNFSSYHIDVQQIPENHPIINYFCTGKNRIDKNKVAIKLESSNLIAKQSKELIQIMEVLQKLHASVVFPYFVKGELIGFMSVGKKISEVPFSSYDLQFLETLASQSAISIENARLYTRALQREIELMALHEVGQVVTSNQSLDESLKTILDIIIKVIHVDRGIIFLYDKKHQKLIARAAKGREEDWQKINLEELTLPVKKTVFGRILRTKHPLVKSKSNLNRHATKKGDALSKLGNYFLELLEVEAYIAMPLVNKDQVIGILAVDNKVNQTPIEKVNIGLLTTLANQAAIAIENTRLYRESQTQLEALISLNQELREMKNYNEDILSNMASGVIVMDSKGCLQKINRQAEILTGKTQKEVLGKKPAALWPQEKDFREVLSQAKNESNLKEITFKSNKDKQHFCVTITLLKDVHDKVKGKLAVIVDTTELKKLEQQVRRSDKLSALGRMAAGVAHEIKNPLTSMRLFIQMMNEKYHSDHSFWDAHNGILLNELDRLDKIVGDFVGFAKTPELKIEPLKLNDIIEKVLRLIKVQAQEQKFTIDVILNKSLMISGDAHHLTQIFINLILNAMQAMPADRSEGRLILKAKKTKNKTVEIKFIDNGEGTPEENMEKLFTPFFTTKEKGTGLGLSIIHKLIEEHGGTINVTSKVGTGTTFIVNLPAAEEERADVYLLRP